MKSLRLKKKGKMEDEHFTWKNKHLTYIPLEKLWKRWDKEKAKCDKIINRW